MTAKDYLDDRVVDQMEWYSRKSGWNQTWYKRLRIAVIVASVLIPFLTGFIEQFGTPVTITVGILGVSIALFEGIQSLYKFQENWLEYRKTSELLKREKLLYDTKSGAYKEDQSLQKLVERCESIMGGENSTWLENQLKEDESPPA